MDELINENEKLKTEYELLQKYESDIRKLHDKLLTKNRELNAEINRLESELANDPSRNYIVNNRNKKIVELITEVFSFIGDPTKLI